MNCPVVRNTVSPQSKYPAVCEGISTLSVFFIAPFENISPSGFNKHVINVKTYKKADCSKFSLSKIVPVSHAPLLTNFLFML